MRPSQHLRRGAQPIPGIRLSHVVGRGGFAQVWKAEHADGRPLAIKFLPVRESSVAIRELKTIQAISQLHHPHLIHVEKVWFQPGYICIAMELADGTLHDLLSVYQRECGTAMFPDQVCTYLFQAAEAIDFLNTRQHQLDGQKFAFQHCDIKPSNIMVIGDSIKISDFGLATPMASTRARRPLSGTIDFSPPEFSHGEVSNRSDQYSLAVTYCLLRGGRLPFKNLPSKFDPTFVRPTPDLMMLTETERSVIARALSVSPPNRWPNCVDMIIELSSALGVALPISALTSQSGRLSPR